MRPTRFPVIPITLLTLLSLLLIATTLTAAEIPAP
jgi:hypothetical protein